MSLLREAIQRKGPLVGTLISLPLPTIAEALSKSGLDWLMFDLEHSVMALGEVQSMLQAMDNSCLSFLRVEEAAAVYVKKALDTGCAGIIVPQVNSAALARQMVKAGKYHPLGERGVGLGRALGYGSSLREGVLTQNSKCSLIVQIEHADAVEAVDEILSIEGIDGIFVGPYDLSSSYGMPGAIKEDKVQNAIARVLEAAKAIQKPAGIFVASAIEARYAIGQGFDFVAVGADVVRLVTATQTMCAEAKA